MRVYELALQHPDEGNVISWHPSKAEAERLGREEFNRGGYDRMMVFGHTIPTDKRGLLRWLNTHVTKDNG